MPPWSDHQGSIELAELYTRDAEQEHLAEGGMSVWEGKATR